ncbi:MAG TPA: TonB-dependent receptor, partial [Acidobacteriaceae bacterium]
VEVTTNTIQLATYDSPTISSDLDAARISQIPENGRSVTNLLVQVTPDGFGGGDFGRPQFNGGEWQATNIIQDGSTNVDLDYGGSLLAQPDIDSMQEVRVETSVSNAKYSAPTSAIINTKSGTNALHGSLFETAVNNAIGIARSRSNPVGFAQAHYVRNEFGGSLGGPIRIPKLYDGRNKSFFFFAYERFALRSDSYLQTNVPTAAMRQGNFNNLNYSDGTPLVIYDPNTTSAGTPWTRTPFANNTIDPNREAPFAKVMNAITPLPTSAANPYAANSSNLNYPALNNTTLPTITFRLDHTFNEKNNAYLRFSSMLYSIEQYYGSQALPASIAGGGLPAGVSNLTGTSQPEYTAALGYTHVFSPTLISQTVFGGTWETEFYNIPPVGANTNFEAQLGLPNNFGSLSMPNVSGTVYPLSASQRQWGSTEDILSINEDLTKTLGRHQIMFGGRVGYSQVSVLPDRSPDTISFNSQATGIYDPASGAQYNQKADTGANDADLFLGAASAYSQVLQPGRENWRSQQYALYLQDDIHLSNKLTINAGVRWEGLPAPIELNNLVNGFDLANKAVVLGAPISQLIAQNRTTQGIITNLQNLGVVFETTSQAGMPDHIMHGDYHIFEPRVGFAYSIFGSGRGTVLRGGIGRYTFPMPIRDIYQNTGVDAPYSLSYSQSYTAGAQSPDGLNNYQLRSPVTVVAGQNSANVVSTGGINSILPGVREVFPDPNTPPNMMWEMNGTIEQPLKPSSVLRLSYVYDYSNNLDQEYAINNAMSAYAWEKKTGTAPPSGTYSSVALNPYDSHTYGTVTQITPSGWSTYNAFTANYQRLYKHGYSYQVAYTIRKGFRVGGNNSRDTILYPAGDYAPGFVPGDGSMHALDRAQNYGVNTQFGPQTIIFNGIVDLPVGRGKKFFGKSSRWLDEIIGGYQVAWNGSIWQNWMGVTSSNWGGDNPTNGGTVGDIHVYKHKYPVTDCSSGVCLKGYLWYNGYNSPLNITNPCTGVHLITGLPADYQPYQTPINMDPGAYTCTNGVFKAGNAQYLNNNVPVTLANGSTVQVGYSPGPATNRFAHTFLHSPWFMSPDASVFKVFPIHESVNLRLNVDAFNVFNIQGNNAPNSNGIQYFTSSHNTPRQIQLSARVTF